MSKKERKLVTAIQCSATAYLDANSYAERYLASREFVDAIIDFQIYALRLKVESEIS